VLPAGLELVPCDPARDGELIRSLTCANFYEAMETTWNEARHLGTPFKWAGELAAAIRHSK
jgi:hypothetical protein